MKTALFVVLCVTLLTLGATATIPDKSATFKTDFTITFNALTLRQAADKEQAIRELFKDACDIRVAMSTRDPRVSSWSADIDTAQVWVPAPLYMDSVAPNNRIFIKPIR